MRARLAIASAEVSCELREIVLRDKAPEFVAASPKATVPVLIASDQILEESLEIMRWALEQYDPENWLGMPDEGAALIERADGPFKTALDRYKYASRHTDVDVGAEKAKAGRFLLELDDRLDNDRFLFGELPSLADMAILPFVRQFAHVDLKWFQSQSWTALSAWLEAFKASDRFARIMKKYPKWQAGDPITRFP